MKNRFVMILLTGLLPAVARPADFSDLRFSPDPVGRYEKLEIAFGVNSVYDNPFDSSEVAIDAVFTSPSGKSWTVPAFWFQDFRRVLSGGEEILIESGGPEWRVRFTPVETGVHSFILVLSDKNGRSRTAPRSFAVKSSNRKGFIRVCSRDSRFLEFDGGDFYFPMGQNVGWAGVKGTYDFDQWMGRMAAAGENWIRIWCTHFGKGQSLEWNQNYYSGWYHGLGRYSQQGAWKWDYLIGKAEALGLGVQMVTQHHGQFSKNTNSNWDECPYNAANGGFLNGGDEFFSNPRAKALYKRKMRYTVARWGYSPAILAWELFNEVMWTDNYELNYPVVAQWHEEMAEYIHAIDPWKHIVTTSARDADSLIWSSPAMDISQIHYYGAGLIEALRSRQEMMVPYAKPNIIGEFGDDWQGGGNDPKGTAIHQGLWATALLGGGAMPWWWDSLVDPFNLYYHWRVLSDFWRGEDLRTGDFEPVRVLCYGGPTAPSSARAVPGKGWEASTRTEFRIDPDGTVPGIEGLSQYFQGSDKADMGREAVFRMDFSRSLTFRVLIGDVSSFDPGILRIFLDGSATPSFDQAARKNLLAAVTVPPGVHTVRVYNAGTDWFTVRFFQFEGVSIPAARGFGLSDGSTAYVWVQDRNQQAGETSAATLSGVHAVLTGMKTAGFRAEFWNTWSGESAPVGTIWTADSLDIGPFDVTGDAALKIKSGVPGPEPAGGFRLGGNWPNPFRTGTVIGYEIPENMDVALDVFDSRGRFVSTLDRGMRDAGLHEITWLGYGLPSGVYLIRLKTGSRSAVKKAVCIR
jgi:hypothetical protein